MSLKRCSNLLLVGTVSLLGFLLASCSESDDQGKDTAPVVRPVLTQQVEETGSAIRRSYPAIVLPAQQAELSFRVSGRIVELPVRAAAQVKKGDVIAQLDTRDFKAEVARLVNQLAQANAQLSAMTTGARSEDIASLEASVAAAEAQVKAAQDQVERTRSLFDQGIVTKSKLDGDLTNLEVTEAQLEAQKQELIKGQSGSRSEEVEAQQAAVKGLQVQLNTAKDNLSDTTLRAPFDGMVAKRSTDNFRNIQAKETVVVLQQLDTLDLTFDVPGPDIVRLAGRENPIPTARLDGIEDREFEAQFVELTAQADPTTQTFRGRVSIKPPEGILILPGMSGTVTVTDARENASTILVPASAVASMADGSAIVWVLNGGDSTVDTRAVKTGDATGPDVAIIEGLVAGDVIVTKGISQLQPGMAVRPVSSIGD